jgi:hypothetical protein
MTFTAVAIIAAGPARSAVTPPIGARRHADRDDNDD